MENKNGLQVFEQSGLGKLRVIQINEEDVFNLSDVCFGLGYTRNNSIGKSYLRKDDVESKCKTLDIVGVSLTVTNINITKDIDFENTYINEDSFYDLCLESKAKNARTFRKWVTSEVLPSLRKRGVYIMEHADEKIIDKEKLFGKRRIKNTFANAEIHEVEKIYDNFLEYVSNEYNAKEKINMLQSVFNGLGELSLRLSHDAVKNVGKCYDISLLQNKVLKDKAYYQNKRNGGIKSSKTKEIDKRGKLINEMDEIIKDQQYKLSTLNPSIDEYMCLDKHGMSNNYLFESVKDKWSDENIIVKTNTYKNWINSFPSYQLKDKDELNVDWSKPIIVFLKFDCIESIDVQNLTKSAIDQIITKFYKEDDNIVEKVIVERNNIVGSYNDGKIYVCIRNID